MISLEEARQYFPRDQRPSDDEIRKLLKFFYWAANSEYERLLEEKDIDRPPP